MNKQNRKKQTERGITLIALVLMIVIVVILAAVTIRGLTGNEGIINVTEMAAIDYNVQSYREQVEQEVRSIIIAHSTVGEEATLVQIADDLKEESLWVKDAVARVGTKNDDILVTVTEGYTYQVYYNETYGTVFVEFVGQEDSFPSLESEFTKSKVTITADTKETAEKVELIYRGEVKETRGKDEIQSGSVTFDVEDYGTGWYKVRATASNGNVRYNWVRVSTVNGRLTPPNISLEPADPTGNSPWYKTQPVKVTITTDNEGAKEIHYCLGGASLTEGKKDNQEGEHGEETGKGEASKPLTFTITAEGTSTITAWVTDDEGAESEIASATVKIDTSKPTGIVLTAKGTNNEGANDKGWFKTDVNVGVSATEDKPSGLAGYYTQIDSGAKATSMKEMKDTFKVDKEGKTKVKVYVEDKAGNEETQETTINIDKKNPNIPNVTISNEGAREFTVAISGTDKGQQEEQSGIDKIVLTVTNTTTNEQVYTETIQNQDESKKNFETTKNITNLAPNKTYSVVVVIYDRAGNNETSESQQGHTKQILEAPTITIIPEDGCKLCDSDWYDGNVRVKIEDITPDSTATKIKYTMTENGKQVTNAEKEFNPSTHEIEFEVKNDTFKEDGTFVIDAWTSDGEETSKEKDEETFKRDTMNPELPTVSIKDNSVSTKGFTVVVSAEDCKTCGTQSGIEKCEIKVEKEDGTVVNTQTINTQSTQNSIISQECNISGLTPGVTYSIYAESTDRVGHTRTTRDTQNKLTQKTTQKLEQPKITFKQKTGQGPSDTQNGWFTGDVAVTIEDTATDSTAIGIKYTITDIENVTGEQTRLFSGESREVSFDITTDTTGKNNGTHEIQAWTYDDGGKCTTPANGTLHIDTVNPLDTTLKEVDNATTSTSFSIDVSNVKDGGDVKKASGIESCVLTLTGGNISTQTYNLTSDEINKGTTTHQFSGLVGGIQYTITAVTTDKAGNKSTTSTTVTTKQVLQAPTISFDTEGSVANSTFLNQWYNGNVKVTITDTAKDSTANKIYYKVNENGKVGSEQCIIIQPGQTSVTFNLNKDTSNTLNTDGKYTIEAWTASGDTKSTCSGTNSFNRDGTPPVLKSLDTTPNDLHSIKYNISADDQGGSGVDCFKIDANQLMDGNARN